MADSPAGQHQSTIKNPPAHAVGLAFGACSAIMQLRQLLCLPNIHAATHLDCPSLPKLPEPPVPLSRGGQGWGSAAMQLTPYVNKEGWLCTRHATFPCSFHPVSRWNTWPSHCYTHCKMHHACSAHNANSVSDTFCDRFLVWQSYIPSRPLVKQSYEAYTNQASGRQSLCVLNLSRLPAVISLSSVATLLQHSGPWCG